MNSTFCTIGISLSAGLLGCIMGYSYITHPHNLIIHIIVFGSTALVIIFGIAGLYAIKKERRRLK